MPAELKTKLQEKAVEAKRTLSAEAQFRLDLSFSDLRLFGELSGLVLMIAYAMERMGKLAAWNATDDLEFWKGDAWLTNPCGYDTAVRAAHSVLEIFRPPGTVDYPDAPLPYRRGSPPVKVSTQVAEMINDYLLGSSDKAPSAPDVRRLLSPETLKRLRSKVQ
jgi:hypothetical protein